MAIIVNVKNYGDLQNVVLKESSSTIIFEGKGKKIFRFITGYDKDFRTWTGAYFLVGDIKSINTDKQDFLKYVSKQMKILGFKEKQVEHPDHLKFRDKKDIQIIIPSEFIFHSSNPLNRDRILKNGLITYRGAQWLEDTPLKGKAVFATDSGNKKDWFDSGYDDDIWKISTKGLKINWYKDPNFLWGDYKHIVTFNPIPPYFLELIKKGTGENLD